MNYQLHYNLLIEKALIRNYSKKDAPCYVEKHHIIPKCMGGNNKKDNLVMLTYHEHCVAHLLLVKIHPEQVKLIYAAKRMYSNTQLYKRTISKGAAEWLRIRHADAVSIQFKGKNKGPITDNHRRNLSLSHIGHKDSQETRKKKSDSNKNRIIKDTTRDKLRISRARQINGGDKPVSVLGVEYSSIGQAEIATGISRFNIWRRLNLTKYADYFYLKT